MLFNENDLYKQIYETKNDIQLEAYRKLEDVSLIDIKKDIENNYLSRRVIRFIKRLLK